MQHVSNPCDFGGGILQFNDNVPDQKMCMELAYLLNSWVLNQKIKSNRNEEILLNPDCCIGLQQHDSIGTIAAIRAC